MPRYGFSASIGVHLRFSQADSALHHKAVSMYPSITKAFYWYLCRDIAISPSAGTSTLEPFRFAGLAPFDDAFVLSPISSTRLRVKVIHRSPYAVDIIITVVFDKENEIVSTASCQFFGKYDFGGCIGGIFPTVLYVEQYCVSDRHAEKVDGASDSQASDVSYAAFQHRA